jgi:hypothetical protein
MSSRLRTIRYIAYLFIAIGIVAWLQFGLAFVVSSTLTPGVELLLLPAGIGLLRRREAWRKASVFLVLLAMAVVVAVPILGYTVSPRFTVSVYGSSLDPTSIAAVSFVLVYGAFLLLCLGWVLVTLTRVDVRRAFDESANYGGTD